MRIPLLIIALLIVAAPALAQQRTDTPAGWIVRLDKPAAPRDSTFSFVAMPPGWHITSGPAATLYDPAHSAIDEYTLDAEIFLFPGESDEGYGLFLGGRDLDGDSVSLVAFTLRRDGSFMIEKRSAGVATVVVPWSAHASILRTNGDPVKNVLSVIVARDHIRFRVNDADVTSVPRSGLVTDGIAGLRVGRSLNLHVTEIAIAASGR